MSLKIVKLKAENIKKLVAVEIAPDGTMVKITGKNAAGKTSVLDCIQWALEGMATVTKKPIREGQETGTIQLDLGDILVERVFVDKDGKTGSTLKVTNSQGARFPSPQKMLDELIGRLSFDPLEFMRMKPRDQFDALRELVGLDFSELDGKRRALYDDRTDVNRRLKDAKAQRDGIDVDKAGAKVEESVQSIVDELTEARQTNENIDYAGRQAQELTTNIQEIDAQIKYLEEKRKTTEAERAEYQKQSEAEHVDTTAIEQRLSEVEENNRNAQAFQYYDQLDTRVEELSKQSEKLTDTIAGIDKQKSDQVAATKMPLDGLEFDDGFVTYNGHPIEQASASEQLRVSLAMAMAMNPKLKVIRITDGSLLDSVSMAEVEKLAADNDYQVWMELVDDTGKVGVYIEDGSIKQ